MAPSSIDNCVKYSDKNTCSKCNETTTFLTNNKCCPFGKYNLDGTCTPNPTTVKNCKKYNISTGECDECLSNHQYSHESQLVCCPNNQVWTGNITNTCSLSVSLTTTNYLNCQIFDFSSWKCILCKTSYRFSKGHCCTGDKYWDGHVCLAHNVPNCIAYDPSTQQCSKCTDDTFSLTNSSKNCCLKTQQWSGSCTDYPVADCVQYNSTTSKCESCLGDKYISNGKCCDEDKYWGSSCTLISTLGDSFN